MRQGRVGAFTLIELLVAIAIISILMAILLPAGEKVRHQAYIDDCANNLRQISAAMVMYSNDNHGAFPRTMYVPDQPPTQGTGSSAPDPFGAGGPAANDVTAAMFLLMRVEKLPPLILICPYDDVYEYEPEPAVIATHSNFTDYHKNCGYSIANPYASTAATAAGYKWTNRVRADFALAADVNPGTDLPRDDVLSAMPNSPKSLMQKANSPNHEKEGQNVLFGDGHVQYLLTPFCGVNGDNIYANQAQQVNASPVNQNDSVLLPTDD